MEICFCSFVDDGKETALSDNQKQLQSVTENCKNKYKECEKKKSDIAKIQDNKSKQELRLREIDDNIKLLKTQKEIQQIDVEISQQEKDFATFGNYDELMVKRSTLQRQLDKLRKSKAEIEGRKKGFEDEVRRCHRDLGLHFSTMSFFFFVLKGSFCRFTFTKNYVFE